MQESLVYARWENFLITITRTIESCKTTGCDPMTIFVASEKWSILEAVLSDLLKTLY
ncbi:MAG: hypothetical protein ACRDAI_01960 [Candidatus Rhabdochlamydia sp.]